MYYAQWIVRAFTTLLLELGMSMFSNLSRNLVQWGLQTAKSEGQAIGLRALQDVMKQLDEVARTHAPDVAPHIQGLSTQLVATLVAGLATKK